MTKLNTGKTTKKSPMQAEEQATGKTHEGAPGFARTPETELFMKTTTTFAGEGAFYEDAETTDNRAVELVRQLAVDNWPWVAGFLPWLRNEGNIRTYAIQLAAEAADAVADRPWPIGGFRTPREVVALVQQRGDEPGEILQYSRNTFRYTKKADRMGQPRIPEAVKAGTADAATRLFTQRAVIRYDNDRPMRFADVIELTHPEPKDEQQSVLFQHLLTERHHSEDYEPPVELYSVYMRRQLSKLSPNSRHQLAGHALENPDSPEGRSIKAAAASQWEWVKSWLGEKPEDGTGLSDRQIWELIIPQMGYMAVLRNLRNFDQAGIKDSLANKISQRLADPAEVAMSRQLPFRFLTAWLNVPSVRWGNALEQALQAAIPNVPELDGRTLILIDTSGSMQSFLSERPTRTRPGGVTVNRPTRVQAAALFGLALALKNPGKVDVYGFADGNFIVENIQDSASLLRTTELFCQQIGQVGHGTQLELNLRATYTARKGGYDRVCLFTDEQAFDYPGSQFHSWFGHIGDVAHAVPQSVPVYSWNLAGYGNSAIAAGINRYQLAGLTDASFKIMAMLEMGQNGQWPWENASGR